MIPLRCGFKRPSLLTILASTLWLALFWQPVWAADPLAEVEERLFSQQYATESTSQRLTRLETSIFGAPQSGSDSERSTRLLQVLQRANALRPQAPSHQENTPSENTSGITRFSGKSPQSSPGNQPATSTWSDQSPSQARDATDYPTVTALERQVFSRDFVHESVNKRLDRLERKVFGRNQPQTALVDRVDKLLARYPMVRPTATTTSDASDIPSNSALRSLPDDPSQFVGSSRDTYTKVDALERQVFNGQVNPNALLTERLDKLEIHAYNRTFSGESIDTRINRLLKAHTVSQQRSAYGNQSPPTFQNRPGFQPNPYSTNTTQVYTPPSPSAQPSRQNVQIGAGFSQNSSYSFSPGMMSMLPPDVRSQLGSGGTVASAPGTVILEQRTTGYPVGGPNGFQTFGGPNIPYYNYYNGAGGTTTTRSSTTVIQPQGGTTTIQTTQPFPPNMMGMPQPAYVGNPAFLQGLNNLEINIFGQVNMVEPVPIRLNKLEHALFGQMYVGYPDEQRLANLQKAQQLNALGGLLGKGKAGNIGRAAGSALLGVPLTPQPNPAVIPMPSPITGTQP